MPWVSPSEISLIIHLARQLFVRIHVVAQLFLPQGIFALFEHANFLELSSPVNPEHHRVDSTYTIAPNNEILISHLRELLTKNPGAVIVPDGVSVKWWASACDLPAIVDTHPKSLTSQKKIYLELLHQAFPVVFGTRRTLLKRLGYYQHIYVVHENLTKHIAL